MVICLLALAATMVAGLASPASPVGVQWLVEQTRGNLGYLTKRIDAGNTTGWITRDLPNGALASLLLQSPPPPTHPDIRRGTGGGGGSCGGHVTTTTAMQLLRKFGDRTDTSFNGQAYPLIWHSYKDCLNSTDRAWLFGLFNRSLPATQAAATTQDFSYTNMWLMSTVNSILFGEIVGGQRGELSASIGYTMFETFYNYTRVAGIHEFTSPTYTHVQLTALYAGYIHAARPGARGKFKRMLDLVWAGTAANYYEPRGDLSGPHSRDYDTLLGHGIHYVEVYAHGLPGSMPLRCEWKDPHCEGPAAGATASGTGEPMTVVAISLYNIRHPDGYTPPAAIAALASLGPERVVQDRFIGLELTANGQEARFGDTYNFIKKGDYAIGSASQDYITRTHDKYFPYPGDKLVTILLGGTERSARFHGRPVPQISLQPDWMDSPYGIWAEYPTPFNATLEKASHLALHPGMVQHRNALLATVALNTNDLIDAITLPGFASLATNLILPLATTGAVVLVLPNGTARSLAISPTEPFALDIPVGSTLGIRVGTGALAAKIFVVDGAGGQLPKLQLKSDEVGIEFGAMRLVAYHFTADAPTNLTSASDSHVRLAALLVADSVADARGLTELTARVAASETHSAVLDVDSTTSQSDGSGREGSVVTWSASAVYDGTTLAVDRNLTCSEVAGLVANQTVHQRWNCLVRRSVNGTSIVPGPLRVNGVQVAAL